MVPVNAELLFYNSPVKSWDAIIVGGGIIGLSLGISLRKEGLKVLIVERGEPGREASHAAAGMLADSGLEIPAPLRTLAEASARMYPEFVHELEDEADIKVDLREQGTILISQHAQFPVHAEPLTREQLLALEPALGYLTGKPACPSYAFLNERSVDPRALVSAALKSARHRNVDISSGTEVTEVWIENGQVMGVQTAKTSYVAPTVVNCAGAWTGRIAPLSFPVRPVKGQMVAMVNGPAINHVVRSEKVYLVPRSDGRVVIGSTLEDAGYNKQTDVDTIKLLCDAAVQLLPALSAAKRHEDWAGLRPAAPDELPILGETEVGGYFVASGHYRDGILLAPVTAQVMSAVILNRSVSQDLSSFSPARFQSLVHHGKTEARRKLDG
jgi:glycine oxidase